MSRDHDISIRPRAGRRSAIALAACLSSLAPLVQPGAAQPIPPEWVHRSNEHARVLLDHLARFHPEGAAQLGVTGLDEEIFDLKPGFIDRQMRAGDEAISELKRRLEAEQDPAVRQDIEIMIRTVELNLQGARLSLSHEVPFFSVTSTVFQGLRALLDDQVGPERRPAARVRLERYAGTVKGYEPIARLAEARIRERLGEPGLAGPVKDEVEKELANSATYVDGIEKLFQKYEVKGYQKPFAALKKQLAAYDDFVRAEILPRSRTDFRLPLEIYAHRLERSGVDMPVDELMSRAQVAFKEIQNQMRTLAPLVAKEKGFDSRDYRDVIRELKKRQLVGEAILPHYQGRARDLERIIRENQICTLPDREMLIKLASEAESAAVPAPNMRPPRLIGNTGEMGTFVLPLRIPGSGGKQMSFDDFTFEAASWTLTAHEGRPGHELQFSAMVENGVSLARAIFALNSVNVEGWALYAEAEAQPYEPLDGQIIALQHRLLRAARAFLDPGLQTGVITSEEASRILREEVMLSEAMAHQEVERYTFRSPGQAPSYFVGYNRLLEIRAMAERKLGARFDRKRFNDFLLGQGSVPPSLLRKAVEEEFVPSQMASN